MLDSITGNGGQDEIDKWDDKIFAMSAPRVFSGSQGLEVKGMKSFEETCILLTQHAPKDPKTMTVLEFFMALETIKKQSKGRAKKPSRYVQSDQSE